MEHEKPRDGLSLWLHEDHYKAGASPDLLVAGPLKGTSEMMITVDGAFRLPIEFDRTN